MDRQMMMPDEPPMNPNQERYRRMLAQALMVEQPRPDGSVQSRSFMEAIGNAQAPAGTAMPMKVIDPNQAAAISRMLMR